MGTATSRLRPGALALVSVALAAAGCGSKSAGGAGSASTPAAARQVQVAWPTARIPSGASFSYPPAWKRIHGDAGTASVALLRADNDYVGYLNLTPRQGDESLANWSRFRVEHNRDEGDRQVTTLAVMTGRRFGGGRGSCIKDEYVTGTGARYIEIACLATGARTSAVIVGAAPPGTWRSVAPLLERAIASVSV